MAKAACVCKECYCPIHGDRLVCPTCEGHKGGIVTARRHPGKHSTWGKLGGRPKKRIPTVDKTRNR